MELKVCLFKCLITILKEFYLYLYKVIIHYYSYHKLTLKSENKYK